MVLVLVVGDLHIPQRATAIPQAFQRMFTPGRIHSVFITGNVGCKDAFQAFRRVSDNVYCTRGQYDFAWTRDLPETITVEIEDLVIGMIHGHQVLPNGDKDSLAIVERRLGADILISGATHAPKVSDFDGHLFVNPGSITGAFTSTDATVTPSFVLLDIRGKQVTSFTYFWAPNEDEMPTVGEKSDEGSEDDEGDEKYLRIKKKEWAKE